MKKFLLFLLVYVLVMPLVLAEDCVPSYQCQPWSECKDGLKTRTCVDIVCGKKDLFDRSPCANNGCVPQIKCGEWSDCQYTSKIENLFEGKVDFGGYRFRICEDTNKCVPKFRDEGPCTDSYGLQFSPVQECGEAKLALIDPRSKSTIAKIDFSPLAERGELNLAFVNGQPKYCPSCYNAIIDGSETGIDCGGPDCKPCKSERVMLSALVIFFLWSGSAFFIFLSFKEYFIIRHSSSLISSP